MITIIYTANRKREVITNDITNFLLTTSIFQISQFKDYEQVNHLNLNNSLNHLQRIHRYVDKRTRRKVIPSYQNKIHQPKLSKETMKA